VPLLRLALFFSGAAGLIYEVVWTRQFADVMGSTALAMTSVFSAFMLALALGALAIGRSRRRGGSALVLYGQLEVGVGLTAVVSSAPLVYAPSWLAVHLPSADNFAVALGLNLLAALALIGVPVFLMGGTLPVILNAAEQWTPPHRAAAQLYGINTLGAACGTLAAGFSLIWALGLTRTLAVAVALNLLVGVATWILGARAEPLPVAPADPLAAPSAANRGDRALWLVLVFLSGFAILGYEVLWGRMSKFLLGDRTIAIAALLFVVVSALGLASLLASRFRRIGHNDARAELAAVAWAMLIGALLHLVLVPLASMTAAGMVFTRVLSLSGDFARRVATVWLLVFPPIFILGLSFPLLIATARGLDMFPGRTLGRLLFVNTVGAALGAATATYVLSRWFGTLTGFLVLTLVLLVAAALVLWSSGRTWWRVGAVLALLVAIVAPLRFPSSLIHLRQGETLSDSGEDEFGVQVLAKTATGLLRVRNNRLQLIHDLGHPQTTHAQQMAAHLTVLLARQCADVINIGTGYGITAGTFTLYPDVRSIETIEILPFLIHRQQLFARYNFAYWNDRRVTIHQGDGRHMLLSSRRTYDIVSVSVLDPHLPGSSSLFTTDFYRAVKERLRPGGVMTQLIWGYEFYPITRGLQSVFPALLFFPAYGSSSSNVVAFRDPVDLEQARLHFERLTQAARREIQIIAAADEGLPDPDAYLAGLLAVARKRSPELLEIAAERKGPLHTDDRPILEYMWAHGTPDVSVFDSPLVE